MATISTINDFLLWFCMNLTQILPFAAPPGIAVKDIWNLRFFSIEVDHICKIYKLIM